LAHNERVLRDTPRRIENPIALLVKYLRQGGNGPLWPEKGYKSRAQRRAEEESRAAAEEEAKRQEAELLRFKARLSDGQRQWIRQEARRLVESRQKGEWKIPERLIARAFEDAEREVLKDRFALHQLGRPVPEAPAEE
jgi:hypothetical protein